MIPRVRVVQDQCRLRRHARASADTLRKLRPQSKIEVKFSGHGSKPWVVVEYRPIPSGRQAVIA